MADLEIAIPRKEIASFRRRWKVNELALFGFVVRRDFGPEGNHIFTLASLERGENPTSGTFWGRDDKQRNFH
jgi:predicted nucleotidyltransferase